MNFPRRIVGDYHVDRLQVEVRQRIEPRSTNHPSGLIPVLGIGSVRDHEQNTGQIITNLHMDVRERAEKGHEKLEIRKLGSFSIPNIQSQISNVP